MSDQELRKRWRELVEAVQQECRTHGQDPDVLEAHDSILKLSLPLSRHDQRCAHAFTKNEVLHGSPVRLAREFYSGYKSIREDEWQTGDTYRLMRKAEELAGRIEASDVPLTDEVKEKLGEFLLAFKRLEEVVKKELG